MATTTGNYIRAVLNGSLQGQTVQTVLLWWYYNATPAGIDAGGAAAAVKAAVWTDNLEDLLHETFTLQNIDVRHGSIMSGTPPEQRHILSLNEDGQVVGSDAMPAFVTARVLRYPGTDLFSTTAPEPPAFSKTSYKIGFSGLPEGQCKDGLLTDAAYADWSAFAETIEEITFGGNDYVLMIHRQANTLEGGNVPAWVNVADTNASQLLGTQNTRKF